MQSFPFKIAIVSHSYPSVSDPSRALFVKNEARLISSDHSVEIHLLSAFTLPFMKRAKRHQHPLEDTLPLHQSTYLSVPRRNLSALTQFFISRSLLKSIVKQQPDIVHLHSLFPSGGAAKALKKKGYPVVLTIHGGDWYYNLPRPRLMKRLIDSLHHCDRIVCVGQQLIKDISDYEPALEKKLIHIPHGIDTNIFCRAEEPTGAKKKLRWAPEKTHLLAVGNLFRVKGFDLLLTAFSEITQRPGCHLHIISHREERDAKREVENIMKEKDLKAQVTFYGRQSPEELVQFYRAADILISSSRKEGFGLVVAEAMACGTPVLATRSGGPEEILTDKTGMLVDIEKLATGLEKMISKVNLYDPDYLHAYIDKNYSLSSKMDNLNQVYSELTT